LLRQIGERCTGYTALSSKRLRGFGTHIEHAHRMTMATQGPRHTAAHGTQANHANVVAHSHKSVVEGLSGQKLEQK
jgi:hypothetical protein